MDIEYYERTMHKMYEAKMIIDALEDVKTGRIVDGNKAIQIPATDMGSWD